MAWHWAHNKASSFDPWSESETEWHSNWKDRFPKDWRELIHGSRNRERHNAHIRASHELVFEFLSGGTVLIHHLSRREANENDVVCEAAEFPLKVIMDAER